MKAFKTHENCHLACAEDNHKVEQLLIQCFFFHLLGHDDLQ